MSNKGLDEINIPRFFSEYAVMYFWSIDEAVLLSLSLNPTQDIARSLLEEYNKRVRLLKQAMEYDPILVLNGTINVGYGRYEGYEDYPKVTPISFINWCILQKLNFPSVLIKLIKKISNTSKGRDVLIENNELHHTVERLKTEITRLEQELNSLPISNRVLISTQKGYIAAISKIYGRDRLLNNFGNNGDKKVIPKDTKINSQDKLTLSKMQTDFLLEGISLDDTTIKSITKQSIHHLEEKTKK